MSEKLRKIDPTGLLNLSDNEDEEMEQEQDSNTADSAGVAGNIHTGVHNLSNSEDADSADMPAPPPPLPPLPPMLGRRILRSEFRKIQDPTFEPYTGSGPGLGPMSCRGSDGQSPYGTPLAAAPTINFTTPSGGSVDAAAAAATTASAAAAAAAVISAATPAHQREMAQTATSTCQGTSSTATPGLSGMIGTNTNQSSTQQFKKTSDGTAQTDPLQKNFLRNRKISLTA
jgi:hypothetical protein